MKKIISVMLCVALSIGTLVGCGTKTNSDETVAGKGAQFAEPEKGETVAEIVVKDYGSIHVKFFKDAAPKAVENFVTHAKEGYYEGIKFHRIIKDFMIQGGDPTGTGMEGESIWGAPFEDEFSEDLYPYRGALCMANSGPGTNGSQFFIVQAKPITEDVGEFSSLIEKYKALYGVDVTEEVGKSYDELGGTPWLHNAHTVFGQMISGYEVLDKIADVEVDSPDSGSPLSEVIIEKINIYEY